MLAKMWKKILLAVCIIACIFNLMAKLVNRHSLESNLKRANDGNTVLDSIRIDKEENKVESKSSNKIENSLTQNTTVIDKQEKNQRNTESKNKTSEETQDEERKTYKYTDFVLTF